MDNPGDSAQPSEPSNPVDSTALPNNSVRDSAGHFPLAYATPCRLPGDPPNVLIRTIAFVVGFVGGFVLVAFSGVRLGLFVFDTVHSGIVPAMLYFFFLAIIAIAVRRSYRHPEMQRSEGRWLVLGLLIGGGLTCLLEGTCFAFATWRI